MLRDKWDNELDSSFARIILISGTGGILFVLLWAVRYFMTSSQIRQNGISLKAQRAKIPKRDFEAEDEKNDAAKTRSVGIIQNYSLENVTK